MVTHTMKKIKTEKGNMAREQIAILNRVARKSFTDIFEQTLKKKTSTMQLSGERILDRGMLSAKVS